jgi:hypothetical protein
LAGLISIPSRSISSTPQKKWIPRLGLGREFDVCLHCLRYVLLCLIHSTGAVHPVFVTNIPTGSSCCRHIPYFSRLQEFPWSIACLTNSTAFTKPFATPRPLRRFVELFNQEMDREVSCAHAGSAGPFISLNEQLIA